MSVTFPKSPGFQENLVGKFLESRGNKQEETGISEKLVNFENVSITRVQLTSCFYSKVL